MPKPPIKTSIGQAYLINCAAQYKGNTAPRRPPTQVPPTRMASQSLEHNRKKLWLDESQPNQKPFPQPAQAVECQRSAGDHILDDVTIGKLDHDIYLQLTRFCYLYKVTIYFSAKQKRLASWRGAFKKLHSRNSSKTRTRHNLN